MVAPFWADVDTSNNAGEVFYHETTDFADLTRANNQIAQAFPTLIPFTASHLLIVTWYHVGYFDSKMDKVIISLNIIQLDIKL